MNWIRLALISTMALGVMVGCGDDGGGEDVMNPDAAVPAMCMGSGDEYTFVLNMVGLAEVAGTESRGFNLDGANNNDECGNSFDDYEHPNASYGEGIDNALGALAPTLAGFTGDISQLIQDQVDQGDLLLIVTLSDVDSLTSDDCITTTVSLGAAGQMVSGAGQTFDIDGSFTPVVATGNIANGVASVSISTLPLSFAIGDPGEEVTVNLTVSNVRFRFNVTETTVSNLDVGGTIGVAAVAQEIAMIPDLGVDVSVIQPILAGSADVGPVGAGDTCDNISAALIGSGIRAEVGTTIGGGGDGGT